MLRHAIAFAACATSAFADPTLVTFRVDGPVATVPRAINSAGDVTGTYSGFDAVSHGFIRYHDGTIVTFDALKNAAYGTTASKINDNGDVAGMIYEPIDKISRGFVRSAADGKIKFFDAPGTYEINITGFNNKGEVTGYRIDDSPNPTRGFVRTPSGRVQVFDIPTAIWTYPGAITNRGVIVGVYGLTQSHGFMRSRNGAIATIDPPHDTYSSIVAMNNAGTMAGYISNEGAFVRTADGTITTFKVANSKNVNIKGMNADGTVTGYYGHQGGRGFARTLDGTITTFDYGYQRNTYPEAINDSGVITGAYEAYPDKSDRAGFLLIPDQRTRKQHQHH